MQQVHEISVQDLLLLGLVQTEGKKPLQLLLRAPHGEVRAENQPVGADFVNEAQNKLPVDHAERGGCVIQNAFRL